MRLEAVGGEDSGERSGFTTKTNHEQERAEAAEFVPLPNSATSAASCSINLLARGRKEITKSRKTGKHEKERVNVGAGGARQLGKLKWEESKDVAMRGAKKSGEVRRTSGEQTGEQRANKIANLLLSNELRGKIKK